MSGGPTSPETRKDDDFTVLMVSGVIRCSGGGRNGDRAFEIGLRNDSLAIPVRRNVVIVFSEVFGIEVKKEEEGDEHDHAIIKMQKRRRTTRNDDDDDDQEGNESAK
mmetsp:Transcript_8347/g.18223  ORF Transcript_8347/g.18223 Transcript_8347/m.18223 type:complete len:107 (+) Transcript_8347:2338-2658(+)